MKYPRLVTEAATPAVVVLEAEPNEFGERSSTSLSLKCNWQSSGGVVYTDDRQKITLTGTALFDGDICPDMAVISSGTVTVFGVTHRIVRGQKCRNSDGSVNYTRLDVV